MKQVHMKTKLIWNIEFIILQLHLFLHTQTIPMILDVKILNLRFRPLEFSISL